MNLNSSPSPGPAPDSGSELESLIRGRAQRLTAPDAAWRSGILAACEAEAVPAEAKRRWFPASTLWGSLAACWLVVLLLNHDIKRRSSGLEALAAAPGPAPEMGLVMASLFPHRDLALLVQPPPVPRRLQPPPAVLPKRPPHQSRIREAGSRGSGWPV